MNVVIYETHCNNLATIISSVTVDITKKKLVIQYVRKYLNSIFLFWTFISFL